MMRYLTKKRTKRIPNRIANHPMHIASIVRAFSSQQKNELHDVLFKSFDSYHKTITPVKEFGLEFVYPKTIDDALDLISEVSFLIDFFLRKSDEYNFFLILSKCSKDYWQTIVKHVAFPMNTNKNDDRQYLFLSDALASSKFSNADFALLAIEAIAVFAKGIEEIDIPKKYLYYVTGISKQAVQKLVVDFHDFVQTLSTKEPEVLTGELLGKSMAIHAGLDK